MSTPHLVALRSGPDPRRVQHFVESPSRFVVHYRVPLPGPSAAKAALKLPLGFGKRIRPVRAPLPGGMALFDVKLDDGQAPGYDDLAGVRDAAMNHVRCGIGVRTDAVACYHAYRRLPDETSAPRAGMTDDPEAEVFPSGKLFLEFHEAVPEAYRRKVLDHYALVVERAVPYWPGAYIVCVTQKTGASPVNLAKELQALTFKVRESNKQPLLFDWADPLFHRRRRFHSIPTDSLFRFQWHLHNDGTQGGEPGADIRAPEAWDITRGHPSVRVAIIDDAFDLHHTEIEAGHRLVASLDANTGETDVSPSRDADQWHGTSVLGLIAAAHNGRGCCGVAPNCSLITVKLDALSDDEAEARAFDFAVEKGAHVINCSWGPYDDYSRSPWPLPRVVELAIGNAYQNHVPVVFAAGNGSEDIAGDGYVNGQHVIAVSASTDQDKRAYFSDYGDNVWVCAPSSGGASSIVTTDVSTGGYNPLGTYSEGFGGTSAAAPLVTGVIALMQSAYAARHPGKGRLPVDTIKDILKNTARKIDGDGADFLEYWERQPVSVRYQRGRSLAYGYGVVDAGRAVRAVAKLGAQGAKPVPTERWDGEGPAPASVWHFVERGTPPLKQRKVEDPLSFFVGELARDRRAATLAKTRFESGEHVWLGELGFKRALTENPRFAKAGLTYDKHTALRREDGKKSFSYGEIVALSGDFYRTPGELYWEKKALLSFLWEKNDLEDLKKGFAKELAAIREQQKGKIEYPDNNIAYWWNAKNYVELAKNNVVHFGWHNMVAYCRYHDQAIELAKTACRYRGTQETSKEQESWRQALFYNAFADHFLTDGFAAGHIRVPRKQIIDWAAKRGWSLTVAGALSKLIHDQDGHITGARHDQAHGGSASPNDGLPVQNSQGDRWAARCDGQLFIGHSAADTILLCPVEAVKASVTELCEAYLFDQAPPGIYGGTLFVPFPDPSQPKLIDKFPAKVDGQLLQRLYDGMQWYLKLPLWKGVRVSKDQVRALFQALPGLMGEFGKDVASEASAKPDLARRLPGSLIEAFKAIA